MTNPPGSFIWYELMTPDNGASADFYAGLLGWQMGGDPHYREITASEGMVGGMLQLTPEMSSGGARPAWVAYLSVEDVDRTVAQVEAQGGRVLMPARDMEDVGRFAMIADPQGVPSYVMRPIPPADRPDASSNAFAAERPMLGHCAWNELSTTDPAGAWRFYGDLFGWTKDGAMPMGEMGDYEFIRHGDHMLGAIMPKMPQAPAPAWTYYFRVADIDVAARYIKDRGATLFLEPMEIPGGDYSLHAADPQGAAFGLVGPRR
ncbi:VOC family protein [Sphingomonas sp. ID1715]|uniref:VOC family protein n=1 Tax=Sphingomonas sp. ID1715 TaxID=1656898 RepID=UPI0014893EF7|nr:VOC family protein [Sphingomonas sp. ID1715]NNM78677.1 VOC family protein [Sphingomonas sp. ID1715]